LPSGVGVVRCWCGDPCKVKEVTYFSNKLGMNIHVCQFMSMIHLLRIRRMTSLLYVLTMMNRQIVVFLLIFLLMFLLVF
jgi:hypothetical protein